MQNNIHLYYYNKDNRYQGWNKYHGEQSDGLSIHSWLIDGNCIKVNGVIYTDYVTLITALDTQKKEG